MRFNRIFPTSGMYYEDVCDETEVIKLFRKLLKRKINFEEIYEIFCGYMKHKSASFYVTEETIIGQKLEIIKMFIKLCRKTRILPKKLSNVIFEGDSKLFFGI